MDGRAKTDHGGGGERDRIHGDAKPVGEVGDGQAVVAAIGGLQTANLMKLFDNSFPKAASVMAAIYVVGIFIVWLGPETKGKELPE